MNYSRFLIRFISKKWVSLDEVPMNWKFPESNQLILPIAFTRCLWFSRYYQLIPIHRRRLVDQKKHKKISFFKNSRGKHPQKNHRVLKWDIKHSFEKCHAYVCTQGIRNDWPVGTCCPAQGTLPKSLWWSTWRKNLKENGCVYNWITVVEQKLSHCKSTIPY